MPEFTYLRRLALTGLSAATLLTGCGPAGRDANGGPEIVFEDTIPCADCPGIIMQIRFDTVARTYSRRMTYLEATEGKDATFSAAGSYSTERGYKGDEKALLYVLDAPPSGSEQVFLAAGDSVLVLLDGNRELIHSELNFRLRRK